MNPLRYFDREALGTLRTRIRWRWKALLTQRGIAPEDGDESTAMVAFATFVTLVGVGILTFGLWGMARVNPTTDLGLVGASVVALVVLFIGWKLVIDGMLELSYLAYVGWRPPTPTDEVTLIALGRAGFTITALALFAGIVGGIAGAVADITGYYGGWLTRMWPWFALTACISLLASGIVMVVGKRAFGDRFPENDPEKRVEGVEG